MKMIKVFFNGEPLKNIYPYASKFQIFKYKFMKKLAWLFKRVLVIAFFTGMIVGFYQSYELGRRTAVPVYVNAEVKSQAMFDGKIEKLKDEVIAVLRSCESAGHSEEDGILIFDSNEKASIGTLQFQKNTVIHYYKVLYGKEITGKEAVMIALDNEKAGQLAKAIAFETKNMIGRDWYNCAEKHGLDEQVRLIKKMEVL